MAGTKKKPVAKKAATKKAKKHTAKVPMKKVSKKVTKKPGKNAAKKATTKKKGSANSNIKKTKLPSTEKVVYPTEVSDKTKKKLAILDKSFSKSLNSSTENTKQVKVTSSDPEASQEVYIKKRTSLAILSPHRFPSIRHISPESVARVTGMAFIIVGALLTTFNMSALNQGQFFSTVSNAYNLATVGGGTGSTTEDAPMVDPEPEANFSPNLDNGFLKGMTFVQIQVPYADEVELWATHKETNDDLQIGYANQLNSNTWKVYFDSTMFPDGEYTFFAHIINEYTGYVSDDSTRYEIKNLGEPEPPAAFLIPSSPLQGIEEIRVDVPNADEVALMAEDIQSPGPVHIGYMDYQNGDTWLLDFDSTLFDDGEYKLIALINNQLADYEDVSNTFIIDNGTAETTEEIGEETTEESTEDTTEETTDDETTPEEIADGYVTLEVDETEPLEGGVRFAISSNTDSPVKMYAILPSSSFMYLGNAYQNDVEEWMYNWDSTAFPNGEYTFFAKTLIDGAVQKSVEIIIEVYNDNAPDEETFEIPTTTDEYEDLGDEDNPFETDAKISLSKDVPLSGYVEVIAESHNTDKVELFVVPEHSLIEKYIGTPHRISNTKWKFAWDTRNTPNGKYTLLLIAHTQYGEVEAVRKFVGISNQVSEPITEDQEAIIDDMLKAGDDIISETDDPEQAYEESDEELEELYAEPVKKTVYVEPVDTFIETLTFDEESDDTKETIEILLHTFRNELNTYLDSYARALRSDNTDGVNRIKQEIESLKQDAIAQLPNSTDKKDLIDDINAYLSKITFELEELVIRNEKIIKERVGDAATKDSDADGVTDFDEVNLYNTNPFVADSDGDGSPDGSEIALGYDPLDDRKEALVVYESAKETGIVREDILTIERVTNVDESEPDESTVIEQKRPKALIAGTALPNSFVTLYIYSTPIVVTVKTDSSGRWSYVFDKDLEDGEHEVIVGITDNEGKIVAKSEPFAFVKTAEAFEGTNPFTGNTFEEATPSLISTNALLAIASLAVVALGLVLLILGVFASDRRYPKKIGEVNLST